MIRPLLALSAAVAAPKKSESALLPLEDNPETGLTGVPGEAAVTGPEPKLTAGRTPRASPASLL